MKFFITLNKPIVYKTLFAKTVEHLLARDAELTCSALNCHNCEVNFAVHFIVSVITHNRLVYIMSYIVLQNYK